jgi:hypothetical protein
VHRSLLAPGLAAFASLLFGCTPTSSGGTSSAASSTSAPSSTPSSEPGTVAAAKPPPAITTWSGKYTSEPGSLYVFDGGEWASVTWRGDEAGIGLGDGTLTLTVNRETKEVRGTAEGAIGDVVLVGSIADDTVTGSVLRKDPQDRGLTGTLIAKLSGEALSGSMKLSVANARVIREVKFTVTHAKAGP